MNNEIAVLKETKVLEQRFTVYGTAEEPLFLAKDVAEMIEHSDVSKMMRLVDEDEKLNGTIFRSGSKSNEEEALMCLLGTSGQNRQMWFLTEDGLYEVLMQSRKPIAKAFKKGVKQILKEIRTQGGYLATTEYDTPEMIMAKAIKLADGKIKEQAEIIAEQEAELHRLDYKLLWANGQTAKSEFIRKELEREIRQQEPMVEFARAVIGSEGTCSVDELAKILCSRGVQIGRNRLFGWLREHQYLFNNGKDNIPYQRWVEYGLFELKCGLVMCGDGSQRHTHTTRVTAKGQEYFINKFLSLIKR